MVSGPDPAVQPPNGRSLFAAMIACPSVQSLLELGFCAVVFTTIGFADAGDTTRRFPLLNATLFLLTPPTVIAPKAEASERMIVINRLFMRFVVDACFEGSPRVESLVELLGVQLKW
jgi:hypothetical protein